MALYDRLLATRIHLSDATLPETIALIITERDILREGSYERLELFLSLATQYGAKSITIYVSVLDEDAVPTLQKQMTGLQASREVAVRSPNNTDSTDAPVQIAIGLGGKHELAIASRHLAEAVSTNLMMAR